MDIQPLYYAGVYSTCVFMLYNILADLQGNHATVLRANIIGAWYLLLCMLDLNYRLLQDL